MPALLVTSDVSPSLILGAYRAPADMVHTVPTAERSVVSWTPTNSTCVLEASQLSPVHTLNSHVVPIVAASYGPVRPSLDAALPGFLDCHQSHPSTAACSLSWRWLRSSPVVKSETKRKAASTTAATTPTTSAAAATTTATPTATPSLTAAPTAAAAAATTAATTLPPSHHRQTTVIVFVASSFRTCPTRSKSLRRKIICRMPSHQTTHMLSSALFMLA